jgi:hypothetical protein
MKRAALAAAAIALGCAGGEPPAAGVDGVARCARIAWSDLAWARSGTLAATPEDPRCRELATERTRRMLEALAARWTPALTGHVALEFEFDLAGKPAHACVLGATSEPLARGALDLVRGFTPESALGAEEALCFGNTRFVAELAPGATR